MAANFAFLWTLPGAYWLVVGTLIVLAVETGARWHQPWAVPALMTYFTIFGWYVLEPLNSPESMVDFEIETVRNAFMSVWVFLVAFRFACPSVASLLAPKVVRLLDRDEIPAEPILKAAASVWLFLAFCALYRMEWNFMQAFFPVESRLLPTMWQRAAAGDAGPFGWLISIASYLYILVLALFGILLPLLRRWSARLFCVGLILFTWPYAFLQGSRNITLAVFVPLVFSVFFFSRIRLRTKLIVGSGAMIFIEWAMRQIITYRNVGFDYQGEVAEHKHLGLNMASELSFIDVYQRSGLLQWEWGKGFLAETAQLIPRFLWPSKPLLGINYAVVRGFGTVGNDIGVTATISTGLVGQGAIEFGPIFGPVAMALLMAVWCGFLARLWSQGTVPRACLFLMGIGLTFNLGRNFTFLVIWPLLFGYFALRVIEWHANFRLRASAGRSPTPRPLERRGI